MVQPWIRRAGLCHLVAVLFWLAGCGAVSEPRSAGRSTQPVSSGWLPSSAGGFIAGIPVPSQTLYESLIPAPHDLLSLGDVQCPSCRAAIGSDGYCGHCGVGWVAQRGYVTRLSYYLAKGNPLDASALACPACRENSRRLGWCDRCGIGMLGEMAYRDRLLYDEAVPSFEILLSSVA